MTTNFAPEFPDFRQKLSEFFASAKTRWRQFAERHPRAVKALKIGGWSVGGLFAGLILLTFLVYWGAFGKLPTYADLKAIQNNTASQVYSEDGVILGKYYIENRLNAGIEEISPFVIEALVATEDARFFEHGGIDLRAWARVFWRTVLLQDISGGGGSTLSQQLAKNLFQRKSHGILTIPVNKIREMLVARRLEKLYSKEELLNLYLNTVPFSENVFGIKVASERFFNTSPKKLRREEAAVLVGMLKGTSIYNPVRYPEKSLVRRNVVLLQMVKYDYLKKTEYDSLQKLPLGLDYRPEGRFQGLATYFREHLRLELADILEKYPKADGSVYNLYTDGLKIYTTLDGRLQQFAEEAVEEHMKKLQADFDNHWRGKKPWGDDKTLKYAVQNSPRYKALKKQGLSEQEIDAVFKKPVSMTVFDWQKGEVERIMSPFDSVKFYLSLLNVGFLAMGPQTGKILAWVGGIDHRFFKYDHVKSHRQAGSTFKPFVYAAALEKGIQPCEYLENALVTYPEYEGWTPQNSEGEYAGVYSMEGGLTHSVNTVTVKLALKTGVGDIKKTAQKLGITSEIPPKPAIALGAADVSLQEMVRAYATFANNGIRPEPFYLTRIETADGTVIVDFEKSRKASAQRSVSQNTAAVVTRMLQTVVDSGTANRLRWEFRLGGRIAGKTGTTQEQSDGWFIGFTPNVAAGVWVGGELPQIRFRSMSLGQGSNTALPIWGKFYRKAVQNLAFKNWEYAQFPPLPDSILAQLDCPLFLQEMPETGGEGSSIGALLTDFFKKEKKDTAQQENARSLSEESERIRRQNEAIKEKRERKKKSKEFWDKVFGREN